MAVSSLTLKLPFLDLNTVKAREFERLQALNTTVANEILKMPHEVRRKLTTKDFGHVEIGSAWMNQTIRNVNAKKKAKHFRLMPLETNNQNWTLHKVGDTYSVGFGLLRGVKKRVPLAVHQSKHGEVLERILSGEAKRGTLRLTRSKRGVWYACISVSWDVPDPPQTTRFIGVDRGQNHLAVAATPEGTPKFWTFARIRQIRKHYAAKRRRLQKAGKLKTVKRLEQKEARTVRHINHIISKEVVAYARRHGCGIRLEDLSGIRTSKQPKGVKRNVAHNRDYWPYYDLEQKILYKAGLAGVRVEKVPPQYTSKTCCKCGAIGERQRHDFHCKRCGYRGHSDHNAARNIGAWLGMACPLELHVAAGGVHGTPPSWVSETSRVRLA